MDIVLGKVNTIKCLSHFAFLANPPIYAHHKTKQEILSNAKFVKIAENCEPAKS
jgi:hypothetical protein